MPNKIMW